MSKFVGLTVVIGFLGVCGFYTPVHAEIFTNSIPGYVWDISGNFDEDLDGITMDYNVVQDGKGKLSGFGYASGEMEGVTINMDFIVKGSVKGKDGYTVLKQKLTAKGTALYLGQVLKFGASVSMFAEIDQINQTMIGTITVSAFGEKSTEFFYEDISSDGMDGSSIMYTSINHVDGKIIGDAILELSNGRQIMLGVIGKEKLGQLLIQAKGKKEDIDSKGSSIKMTLDSLGDIVLLKSKICGQALAYMGPCQTLSVGEFSERVIGRTLEGYKILSATRFSWGGYAGNWTYTKTGNTTAKLVFTFDADGNNPSDYREEVLLECVGDRYIYRYSEYYSDSEEPYSISMGSIKL